MIKFKSNIDKTIITFDNRTEAIKFIRKNIKKLDEKKKAAIVKEYPFHVLMDWGKYKSSVNKVDVYTGDVKLACI